MARYLADNIVPADTVPRVHVLIRRGDDHVFEEFLPGVLIQCFASDSNVRQVSSVADLLDHIFD
jgi:hypothetical protein